ncbi:MAG: mucoidy inhibitor MuiA family protein [Candidatus Thorarchaeota archaeon]|nr:mucoidy inhibitor MuiA family protein [Candidatus Thorarchaeota archaeon]
MTQNIETRISEVTVFRDGARITRRGKAKLVEGEQILMVSGISAYAEENSFRVKGKGNAVLRGIDVKHVSRTYEPEGELKTLRDQLLKLQRRRDDINDAIAQQQARVKRASSMSLQFSSEFGKWYAAGESKMDNLSEMDKATTAILRDAKKRLRDLSRELREVTSAIQATEQNLNRVQGERRTETLTDVSITVNASSATDLELEVTYQLGQSGWTPMYDIDTSEKSSRVKRIATVWNNTLEDWDDVSLTVSTASATRVEAVKAQPLYVDVLRAARQLPKAFALRDRKRMAEPQSGAKEEAGAYEYERAEEQETSATEIEESFAAVSESLGGTVIYAVPGRVTIESGREPHPVTLTEETFVSRVLYYWNAYAMSEVVAQDEVTNGDSVMLPGKVRVYANGDFIGETHINLVAPREKIRIGTRTAYDIKAEKKLALKDTEKAGITKGKKKRAYKYRLELKNFSKNPAEIRIVDRIPYSGSEKITVTLQPPPSLPEKKFEMGVLEWEATIDPGKELQVEYGFEVEWEKDCIITPPLP